MYFVKDLITYIRRLIKSPSPDSISDLTIYGYINRFLLNDIDARIQVFDLKKKYQFVTKPGVDQYNMPLYDASQGGLLGKFTTDVAFYPVYQNFLPPCYINGINCPFYTDKNQFYNLFPNILQNFPVLGKVNNITGINLQIPLLSSSNTNNPPVKSILRGHLDMQGIINLTANEDPPLQTINNNVTPLTSIESKVFINTLSLAGNLITFRDSGFFNPNNFNEGYLLEQDTRHFSSGGTAPFGYDVNVGTVNYITGQISITNTTLNIGRDVDVQCYFFASGLPRSVLFYNNTLTLRPVPDGYYLIEVDAYLTPLAYLRSVPYNAFQYMEEYIARGAARKILSDTGDIEQFNFYESLFREAETLVWKRSQRQWTATRTPSFYSQSTNSNSFGVYGGTV